MKPQKVEYLIIGRGPGGTPTAMALAAAGKSVLLVEKSPGLGGTCLFEGCIPSKIFRESARRLRELREAGEFGLCLPTHDVTVNWSDVLARKRAILKRRSAVLFYSRKRWNRKPMKTKPSRWLPGHKRSSQASRLTWARFHWRCQRAT